MGIKKIIAAGAAVSVLLVSTFVTAEENVGDYYITPSAVYFDDDEDRGVDDGFSGAELAIGKIISDYWNMEFFGDVYGLDGFNQQDQFELGIKFLAVLDRDAAFSPYLHAGASYIDTDLDVGADSKDAAMSAGLGFLWDFGASPFSLRTEYRYRQELGDPELKDQLVSIGLQANIGGGEPTRIDTDGDGVDDNMDRCPNTPLGASVDAYGCELDDDGDGVVNSKDKCPATPAGAKVDARGCEARDSDGDGVADDVDQCPNTPAGARVDAKGCELDDDNDGVVNSKDRCPNTTAGVRVDVNGCEIREVIELPGVTFETNSDRLVAGAERVLDDAAATLRKHPDLVVEVAGHTDSDGSAAYNEGLSERRAKTVMNYLVDRGANGANLTARGYGEAQPVADNSTAVGKARNRRVELRIRNQ